jgi:hypothetical protein
MSYLSRREEELIETKRSQGLALQILEVFTGQSTQDLHRLNLLSSVWQSVDRNILRTLDDAQGKEGTAKLLCELIVWKALEYWLMEDGMPCGQTDAEILAEFKAKVAAAEEAAAKPLADSPEPQSEPVKVEPEPQQQSTCTKLPDGRLQVAFVRPNGQVRNFIANRKRSRPRTYAEILARKTPEQQAEFRRKRNEIQRRSRERLKLAKAALVPGS